MSTERSLLYPLLMLLSRLRPSLGNNDARVVMQQTATTTLLPLLQECSVSDRHFSARIMASRAASNLMPPGKTHVTAVSRIKSRLEALSETPVLDHNEAHGSLLLALNLVQQGGARYVLDSSAAAGPRAHTAPMGSQVRPPQSFNSQKKQY